MERVEHAATLHDDVIHDVVELLRFSTTSQELAVLLRAHANQSPNSAWFLFVLLQMSCCLHLSNENCEDVDAVALTFFRRYKRSD